MRLLLVSALAATVIAVAAPAHACPFPKLATPYWTQLPADLAPDDVVLEVELISDTGKEVDELNPEFRVETVVRGKFDKRTVAIRTSHCSPLALQSFPSHRNLLIGRVARPAEGWLNGLPDRFTLQPTVLDARLRECPREESDGEHIAFTCTSK